MASSSSSSPPLLSPRPRPWASTSRALDSQGPTDSPQTVERMLGGVAGSVWEGDWSGDEGTEESERDGSPRPRRINEKEDHGTRAWSESPPHRPPFTHGQNPNQQQQQQQQQQPSSNPTEPHLHPGLDPSFFAPSSPPQTPDHLRAHQEQQPYLSSPSPPSSASGLVRELEQEEPTSPNSAAAHQLLETLARMSHDPSAIDTSPITGDIPSAGLRRVRGPAMTTLEERTEEGSSVGGGGHAWEQHERMRSLDEEEGSVGSARRSRDIQARLGMLPSSTNTSTLSPILPSNLSSKLEPLPSQVALPASRPSSGIFPTSTSLPFLSTTPSSYPLPTSLSASNLSSTRPTSSPLPHPPPNTSSSIPPPSRSTSDLIAMFERQKQDRLTTPGGSTSASTSPVRSSYLSALPPSPSRSRSPTKKSAFDLSQFGTAATSPQSTFRPVLPPPKDSYSSRLEREETFSDDTTTAEEGLMPIPLAPLPPPRTPPPPPPLTSPFSTRAPAPLQPVEPHPPTPRARQSPLQKVVSAFTSGASRPGGGGGWEAASFGRRSGASWASTTGGSGGLSIIKRAREGLRGRSRDRKEQAEAARVAAVAASAGGGGRATEEVREMRDETSVHTGTVRMRGTPPRVVGTGTGTDEDGKEEGGETSEGQEDEDEETEIEQPLRTGHLWYLNVHDTNYTSTQLPPWIRCDARLFRSALALSWPTSAGRANATIDLTHSTEVRSMPSASHPDARDDLGTLAAAAQDSLLAETLSPFIVIFPDGEERLGTDTALERTRWVAAIWDVLAANGARASRPLPRPAPQALSRAQSSVSSIRSGAQGSEVGSTNTHYRPASFEPTPSSVVPAILSYPHHGIDDLAVLYRDDGLLDPGLSREPSRRMGRGRAGYLRRIGSEADLELQTALPTSEDARPRTEPSHHMETPSATTSPRQLPAISTTNLPRTVAPTLPQVAEDDIISPPTGQTRPPSYHSASSIAVSHAPSSNLLPPKLSEHGTRNRNAFSRQESELSVRSARTEDLQALDRSSSIGSQFSIPRALRDPSVHSGNLSDSGGGLSRSAGVRRQVPRVRSKTLSSPAPSSSTSSSESRRSQGDGGGAGGGAGGGERGAGRRGGSESTSSGGRSSRDVFQTASEHTYSSFATAPAPSTYATAPSTRPSSYGTAPSASTYRSAASSLDSYATPAGSTSSPSFYLTALPGSSSHHSSLFEEETRARPLPPSVRSISEHEVLVRQRPPTVPSSHHSSSTSSSTIRSTAQESAKSSRHLSRVGTTVSSSSVVTQRQQSVGSVPFEVAGGILSEDVNRLLRYLQNQDQQRIGREAVSASQLERIEQGVLTIADPSNLSARPPPVPSKDPSSPSSSSSPSDGGSDRSSSTVRPPGRDLAEILNAQQAILAGQQEVNRLLAEDSRRREEERDHRAQEDQGRRVTLHRLDDMLRRVLWVLGDEVFHGEGGPPSEAESLYGPEVRSHAPASIVEMSEEDVDEWNDDLSTYSSRPRRASISESDLPRAPAASLDEDYFGQEAYGGMATPRTEGSRFGSSDRSFNPSFSSLPSARPPSEQQGGPRTRINLDQLRDRALPPRPLSAASSASTVRVQSHGDELEDYDRRRWEEEEELRRQQELDDEARRQEEEEAQWEADENERIRQEREERQRGRLALSESEDEDAGLTAQARRARRRPPRIQDQADYPTRGAPMPDVLDLPSPVGERRRRLPPVEPEYDRKMRMDPRRRPSQQHLYYDYPEPAQNILADVRPPITRNYWRRGGLRQAPNLPPVFLPRGGYGTGGVGLYGGGYSPGGMYRSGIPPGFGPNMTRNFSPYAPGGYGGYSPGMGGGYGTGFIPGGDRYEGDQGRSRRDGDRDRDGRDRHHRDHSDYSDEDTDDDTRRARHQQNEVARGLNDVAAAVADEQRNHQNEMHNLNDSIDGLRREVHNGSILGQQPTQFGTLAPQLGQTLPGNLATTNDVQRIVEAHSHGSRSRRGSNSPPPVNVPFAAPPAGYATQSFPQPTLQPTQAQLPVVVVGGGGNNPPQETTRIIREEGGGDGGGRGGILSRLAEGVVPDATRRAENAAALGERRREDDMRRETEQRRGDQLRSEEANRRFLEQNRVSEQSRRDEEASRRNGDMLRATTAAAAGGLGGGDRGARQDVQDAARTIERVADRVERAENRRPEVVVAAPPQVQVPQQQPTLVAARPAPEAFETVSSDTSRVQPQMPARLQRPESVQLRPAESTSSNVASAPPSRPDSVASNVASALPPRTTSSPAPPSGNISCDVKERTKTTGPASSSGGIPVVSGGRAEPVGFFRPGPISDGSDGVSTTSNVASGAPNQGSRPPGILKSSTKADGATAESDAGSTRPGTSSSLAGGAPSQPSRPSGFLKPSKNSLETTTTATTESDASRPPSRSDSNISTAPTTAPSTGSTSGGLLTRPAAGQTTTSVGDPGDGKTKVNVRPDAPLGGRPRPVTTIPGLLGPSGDSTSKDTTKTTVSGSAPPSGRAEDGSTSTLATGAPTPISKDSTKAIIEADQGSSRFPSILKRKPVETTTSSNLQGVAPDRTSTTVVGSGGRTLPSRPGETVVVGDGSKAPSLVTKQGEKIVPGRASDSVVLGDGSTAPTAVVGPGGKLVRPGTIIPGGGGGPSMSLNDGAGKSVSVPLPAGGGDTTKLKSKEEVKTGGPFDRPSASFPGEKTKIQSETKSGPFDRPSAGGPSQPSNLSVVDKDGKSVTVPLGPTAASGDTKIKTSDDSKTTGGVPGRPGLQMPGRLGPADGSKVLADGSKAPTQPTLTVKDADGKDVEKVPLGPKLPGAAGKDVVMSDSDALRDLRSVLGDFKTGSDKSRKDDEAWRKTKDERDAKLLAALEKLVGERQAEKKVIDAKAEEDKKKPPPTIQTALDASKAKKEEDDKRMKDALAEIKKQNDASQKAMLEEMKKSAREQVNYNVSGHLDNFSKSLAGEVKTLMKEVGDLRESKRALQHEIADLLLIKARHGGGDGMNLFPWQGAAKPAAAGAGAAKADKPAPTVPATQVKGGGGAQPAVPTKPTLQVGPAQAQQQQPYNPYAAFSYNPPAGQQAPPAPTTQTVGSQLPFVGWPQPQPQAQPIWTPNGWLLPPTTNTK